MKVYADPLLAETVPDGTFGGARTLRRERPKKPAPQLALMPAQESGLLVIPAPPEPPRWGLVVDEVRLNSVAGPAAAWWAEQSGHFDRIGKVRYLAMLPVGAVLEIGPYEQDDAEFMRDHMIEKGVLPQVLKVRRWTEQPHMPKCRKAAPCRLCGKAEAA